MVVLLKDLASNHKVSPENTITILLPRMTSYLVCFKLEPQYLVTRCEGEKGEGRREGPVSIPFLLHLKYVAYLVFTIYY